MKKPTYEELEAEVERLQSALRTVREDLAQAPVDPAAAENARAVVDNALVNLSEGRRPPGRPVHTDGH